MNTRIIGGTTFLVWVALQVAFTDPLFAATDNSSEASAQENSSASMVHYVSDYFSFVGGDAHGRVAFALDTNRGRDGKQWQAEHFAVLHDEREGWRELKGNGFYDNAHHELFIIPDSPFFHFEGDPVAGLLVSSDPNDLHLVIQPITERVVRKHDGGWYWLGSAPATLSWKGRELEGRVIYEYLSKPDFNRLTRTYWGLWNNFQGFYLFVDGLGDLYLHQSEGELMAGLTGRQEAFVVFHDQALALAGVTLSTLTRTMAPGFYRWPGEWHMTWRSGVDRATLRLDTVDFTRIANWVIGGFAMSIVQGQLHYKGKSYAVYGFAELLM